MSYEAVILGGVGIVGSVPAMPICRSIYEVLYHGMAVQDVVSGLMRRAKKDELTETTWL